MEPILTSSAFASFWQPVCHFLQWDLLFHTSYASSSSSFLKSQLVAAWVVCQATHATVPPPTLLVSTRLPLRLSDPKASPCICRLLLLLSTYLNALNIFLQPPLLPNTYFRVCCTRRATRSPTTIDSLQRLAPTLPRDAATWRAIIEYFRLERDLLAILQGVWQ